MHDLLVIAASHYRQHTDDHQASGSNRRHGCEARELRQRPDSYICVTVTTRTLPQSSRDQAMTRSSPV
jgi:hypothetical protein